MLEPKDKVINFRVTYQEYASYCRACSAAGLTNLSEMARVAMRQFARQRGSSVASVDTFRENHLDAVDAGYRDDPSITDGR
jgi:hypothetical protein